MASSLRISFVAPLSLLALVGLLAIGCDNTPASPTDAGPLPGMDAGADAGEEPGPPMGPSEGCGMAAAATGLNPRTITVDGQEREFLLYIPEGYDPSQTHALVFAWHGLGDSAGNFSRWQFQDVTEGQAIVAYPQGIDRSLGAPGWFLGRDGIDVAFFDAMRQSLMDELCVEQSQVFSTGFSYGGFFSNALGCYRGEVIRAIAPMGGGNLADRCQGQVAAMLVHGTEDSVIDYEDFGLVARDFWLAKNHCAETPSPADADGCEAYTCDDGYPVSMCTHGGDHIVPTFAAARIWGFFSALD